MENSEKTVQERLLDAIKAHSGLSEDEIKQAGENGADAGWSGFCYYRETFTFYANNSTEVWALLAENAAEQDLSPLALIASFTGAGAVEDESTLYNLLAWFALEEVGRWLTMRDENTKTEEVK